MKLIFTADDYGVVDAIDIGVCKAVQQGWINSVEVFSNAPSKLGPAIKRLADIELDEYIAKRKLESSGAYVNIGAHLTLTSGCPLTDATLLRKGNDPKESFREWVDFKRPKISLKEEKAMIRTELEAQIIALRDAVEEYDHLEFNHLTSHHNSVYYFEPYASVFFELAKKHKLAVRTPLGRPKLKDALFYWQLYVRLNGDMTDRNRNKMWKFVYNLDQFIQSYQDKPVMPDFHNNVHYGPPPFVRLNPKRIKRKVRAKNRKVKKWLDKHKNDTVEFVFHLINDDYSQLNAYMQSARSNNYPGVKPEYFDGRMAEFRSLSKLMQDIPNLASHLIDWPQLND